MPISLEEIAQRLLDTHEVRCPRYELMAYALAHHRRCTCNNLCTHKRERILRIVKTWGPVVVRKVTREMIRERAQKHWGLVRREMLRQLR